MAEQTRVEEARVLLGELAARRVFQSTEADDEALGVIQVPRGSLGIRCLGKLDRVCGVLRCRVEYIDPLPQNVLFAERPIS